MARRRRPIFSVSTLILFPLLSWLLLFSCSSVQATSDDKDSSSSTSGSSSALTTTANRTSPNLVEAEARDDDHDHDHHHDHHDHHHHHHGHRHHHHKSSVRPSVRKWFNNLLANTRDNGRNKEKGSGSSTSSSKDSNSSHHHHHSSSPSSSSQSPPPPSQPSYTNNPYLVPVPVTASGTPTSGGAMYSPYAQMGYAGVPAAPAGAPAYMTPYAATPSPYASMMGGTSSVSDVSQTPTLVPVSMSSPYAIMAQPMPARSTSSKTSQMQALAAAAAAVYGSTPMYAVSPQLSTYGYDASGFAYAIPVPVVPTYLKSYDHSSRNSGGSRSAQGGTSSHGRYKSRRRLKTNGFDDVDRSPAHLEQLLDSDGGDGSLSRSKEATFGPSFDPSDQLEPFSDVEAGESYSSSSNSGALDGGPSAEEFDGGEDGGGRSKF